MKKVYYEKIGDEYVPVREYDQEFLDAMSKGNHLVMIFPGGQSIRCNVDPNYAAMIAAGRVAEDAICKKINEIASLRMQRKDRDRILTERQKAAWENLVKEMGDSAKQLEWPSVIEIAETAVKAMAEEADKLMTNPSVKKAYEHMLLVSELTKDEN